MSFLCIFGHARLDVVTVSQNTMYDSGSTKEGRDRGDELPIRRETNVILRCPRCGELIQQTLKGHHTLEELIGTEPEISEDSELAKLRKMAGLK